MDRKKNQAMTAQDSRFIDDPLFSFSEVLALTKLGRGTVEGYIKRGTVKLAPAGKTGSGHHRRYTGRDLLKIAGVAFMTKAGLTPEYVAWVVADEVDLKVNPKTGKVLERGRGQFALLVDEFVRVGPTDEFRKKSPFIFNTVVFSPGQGVTGAELGLLVTFNEPDKLIEGQRKWDAVTYLVFDAPLFVWYGFQRLEQYLKERG